MENTHSNLQRKLLLTWLILPILLTWITTNYLIGTFRTPIWSDNKSSTEKLLSPFSKNASNSFQGPAPADIPKITWQGSGLITLWFDDGWISQYTVAYPLVEKYGYKAALAVPTRLIGYDAYMGWAQVKLLQRRGWETTSHTRSHTCILNNSDTKKLDWELRGAAEDLKSMGLRSDNFVSPCGLNSPAMKEIAKKYYISLRTSESGYNNIPITDPYNLLAQTMQNITDINQVRMWIQEAKKTNTWLILMFHQIDNSNRQYSITATMLKNILEEVKKSELQVVLPSQALELIDEASESARIAPPITALSKDRIPVTSTITISYAKH